ncbi:hypothetical protein Pst134EA_031371 [Puccinia striiformis f. sp. tritici]|uniref:DNA ligase n=2 Tax=Puccinia striiformis f. sp. tritici TaxID=168172 RepID=A0A0L0W5Q3_9BASI|nr:uncharacterized protein Pst134EA_031371 [Puccinia striiformis f. sp. tritici]KAH9443367.1 hypothetical protein Pst134EA_031371 [Puccinia striiformis f. sp. tritici]KNF06585.1 hypothetical protein PSTG_00460 [Puccinia striiformis f. sp. tritici PST-78]
MEIKIKSEDGGENEFKTVSVTQERDNQDPLRAIGPSPPFHDFCKVLNLIAAKKKTKACSLPANRRKCLLNLFDDWRKKYGNDLYPCIRLLLPAEDRERPTYFLKEFRLARLYCIALGLDRKTSSTAKRLLNWRSDATDTNQVDKESTAGDFAKLLFREISSRSLVNKTIFSIDDINKHLDSLAAADTEAKRLEIIKIWLNEVAPADHLWLIKIVLQDIGLGLKENFVLKCFHHNAIELYNVCTDLKIICHTLYSPDVPLEDRAVTLKSFNVFKPMLAKRSAKDLPDIVKLMTSGRHKEFLIEEKMDGERIQIHKSGEQYQYWSRNGKNYTDLYGANPATGRLTPYIHSAFKPSVDEVILDGEMLAWDPVKEKIMAFGTVKSLTSSNNREQPRALFKVFDILYLRGKGKPQGTSFINKCLFDRRAVMESGRVFVEIKTRLEFCYSVRGTDTNDIKKSLEKVLEERGEGLIIKRLGSTYQLNGRSDDWYKVKPEYMDELGETFEVLAVGGYWGRGKRGGTFGSFLVAMIDNENSDPSQGIFRYRTLCGVGTGLNLNETKQIMTKLEGKYTEWDKKRTERNPDWLDLGPGSGMTPDVWWHWKDSFLLTIKGAEIIPSSAYGCRCSIRFPRSIRFDIERDIQECMSYEELLGIAGKPHDKEALSNNLSGHVRKRKRNESSQPTSSLRPLKRSDSHKMFFGVEFWVLQGLEGTAESKSELEVMLNHNGGKIIHTIPRPAPDREHFCVTRRTDFWDAEKAIRHGLNLVHPQWVYDSVKAGYRIGLSSAKYVVNMAQAQDGNTIPEHTSVTVKEERDSEDHDDSADKQSNATCDGEDPQSEAEDPQSEEEDPESEEEDPQSEVEDLQSMSGDRRSEASATENGGRDDDVREDLSHLAQKKVERSVSEPEKPSDCKDVPSLIDKPSGIGSRAQVKEGIFYPLVFYLDNQPIIPQKSNVAIDQTVSDDPDGTKSNQLFDRVSQLIENHGGRIVSDVNDADTTHIILDPNDTSRYIDLIRMDKDRQKRRRLVLADWVFESVESESCLYEADYLP